MSSKAQTIIQKTQQDYNTIAKHFSKSRNFVRPELAEFQKLIKDNKVILDWGCGNGNLSILINDKKVDYHGVDQSRELLKIAPDIFKNNAPNAKTNFYCTAKQDKDFPVEYFDLVFMVASFHHLPDYKTRLDLLKKVYKEMKVGAKLIITVWNLESDWAKEKLKKEKWEKTGEHDYLVPWKDQQGKLITKRYYHSFSKEELDNLLQEAGYEILQSSYYNKILKSNYNQTEVDDYDSSQAMSKAMNLVVLAQK